MFSFFFFFILFFYKFSGQVLDLPVADARFDGPGKRLSELDVLRERGWSLDVLDLSSQCS